MSLICSRRTLVASFAALVVSLAVTFPNSAHAQKANWEYVPDLAGGQPAWLDWSTGLVWGDRESLKANYGLYTFDGMNKLFLPLYRANTQIAAWRMPTVAELQTISAHHGYLHMLPESYWDGSPAAYAWGIKGKGSAYGVNLLTGDAISGGGQKNAILYPVPVYRLFTP